MSVPPPDPGDDRLERVAAWLLSGRLLTPLLAATALAFLAAWIPHYLTWPLWVDLDTFDVLAQRWAEGLLPYRDIRAYNFPGQTYLFLLLHRAFGPGWSAPIYGLDATLVVALGLALALWSKRRCGRAYPGLIGYLAFLGYYLDQDYTLVAQREWHAGFCVVAGLLAYQAAPNRWGRLASAVGLAAGMTFRPHVLIFLPAFASALHEEVHSGGEPSRSATRLGLGWLAAFLTALTLAFAPLAAQGLLDDLARSVGFVLAGSAYGRGLGVMGIWAGPLLLKPVFFVLQLAHWDVLAVGAGNLLLALALRPGRERRMARTWLLALGATLLYRPLHAKPSLTYLVQPLILVGAVNLAVLAQLVLAQPRWDALPKCVLILLTLGLAVRDIPTMCAPSHARLALRGMAAGRFEPAARPVGYTTTRREWPRPAFDWDDYRGVLDFLRDRTEPGTPVANLATPAAINGPSLRPSPFRAEGGYFWVREVRPDDLPGFLAAMTADPRTLVVWEPGDPDLAVETRAAVERDFRPIARFGRLELRGRAARPD